MNFQEIDVKKKRLDQAHPLPVYSVTSLLNHVLIDRAYNLNAIEGNTLSISEKKSGIRRNDCRWKNDA
ncbi:hypothetical protein [Psychrobacillus insolitus]|uniref:hypothetical protein n=1 Tax=Psychrobacillus insolitus TaxID=1461 RepID=UPI001FE5B4F8|nr:hypothetical protein [Psychrobacillus insolitus]